MTNKPDDQDLRLGQGGIHVDAGALHVDGYDLVQDIDKTGSGVTVVLTAVAAQEAHIDPVIEIIVENEVLDGITLREAVRKFKDRLSRTPPKAG